MRVHQPEITLWGLNFVGKEMNTSNQTAAFKILEASKLSRGVLPCSLSFLGAKSMSDAKMRVFV